MKLVVNNRWKPSTPTESVADGHDRYARGEDTLVRDTLADPAAAARTRISDFLIGVELADGPKARRIVEALLGIGDTPRTATELAFELGMRRRDVEATFRRALARARAEHAGHRDVRAA